MSDETKISIKMSSYEWGRLLADLEDHMQICNRNQTATIQLWEMIATQLNGGIPVHVQHPQNPDPKYRPAPPSPSKIAGEATPSPTPRGARCGKKWWQRLY